MKYATWFLRSAVLGSCLSCSLHAEEMSVQKMIIGGAGGAAALYAGYKLMPYVSQKIADYRKRRAEEEHLLACKRVKESFKDARSRLENIELHALIVVARRSEQPLVALKQHAQILFQDKSYPLIAAVAELQTCLQHLAIAEKFLAHPPALLLESNCSMGEECAAAVQQCGLVREEIESMVNQLALDGDYQKQHEHYGRWLEQMKLEEQRLAEQRWEFQERLKLEREKIWQQRQQNEYLAYLKDQTQRLQALHDAHHQKIVKIERQYETLHQNLQHVMRTVYDLLAARPSQQAPAVAAAAAPAQKPEQVAAEAECPICYEKNTDLSTECCRQRFHRSCFDRWHNQHHTCPYCRHAAQGQ